MAWSPSLWKRVTGKRANHITVCTSGSRLYRALRFEELKMTARVAAERVQSSRQPFRLNPMSSRERRIVHLALKDMTGVRTESIGVGEERQVVIHPAESKAAR